MAPQKFEDWIPKADVMTRLGLSERTVDRLVEKGKLKQAYKPLAGRRPLPVYDPLSVAELEGEMVKTVPQVLPAVNGQETALARPLPRPDGDALARLAEALTNSRVRLQDKFFLTVPEASELSGLPQAYLLRQIREGKLATIKTGGHRIRRSDLEKL